MTKMAVMPIYGKNPSKIFFFGTSGPIVLNDDPGLYLTYFVSRSNLVIYARVWEKVKIVIFSDTIVASDIKVGSCSQLNEQMKQQEYQRSRSLHHLCPR